MRSCPNCGLESGAEFAFCPRCGTNLAATPSAEQRKTVTVLFCDVTGSTSLGESVDPEALRALLARYFERMKSIVERHGGAVEKFIGDAVMAVFGVPAVHEDDALRAVRAAAEMRDALPDLGLQARIGVNSGEVVTGTEERLATGDAVNVAARLEQAAPPGEVLLGEATIALVGEAAEVEPVESLELKGKAEPVRAYRLLRVGEAPERRHRSRFVGRLRELAIVRDAFERAQAERTCELVTVVGDAGVGKSRLVAEALRTIDASLARGRCLPYGEGITYWPVVEVLKQLDVLPSDERAAAAIRSLLGEQDVVTSTEELAWAFRKTLEETASQRPLLVVFDDIQWGEDTFLDLIEHVALLSTGAPILLLCIARPELLDRRSAWPVTLRLAPLPAEDVERLIPEQIAGPLRDKIARAAGGNPLFIEETVAMAGAADGEVVVPPTLQALLAARLDQLEAAERRVLERGAVEGEIFHRGAVQALAPEETQVTPRLASLVRKELIRPDKAQLPGEDGFRFRHLLIRDAAYEALPKASRAELHELYASWLESQGAELVELDEILGYHLEQAWRCSTELGLPGDGALAAKARARLAAAGGRARIRGDETAAVSLFERAVGLLGGAEVDIALETELADALFWSGRPGDALQRAASLAERAAAAGDRVGELAGRLKEGMFRLHVEPEGQTERLASLVHEALPVLESSGNDVALQTCYFAAGWVASMSLQWSAVTEAFDRAAAHSHAAGLSNDFIGWRATARLMGPAPVSELLEWLEGHEDTWGSLHSFRAIRGQALSMLGRFDEARSLLGDVRAEQLERGVGIQYAVGLAHGDVGVELLGSEPKRAVELGQEGCKLLDELGEHSLLSTALGYLSQAYYALGRLDEADAAAGRAAELGASDDVLTQLLWRQVRAKVLACRGEGEAAEQLGREAVALADTTEMINAQADAYADLGHVLVLGQRTKEAATVFEQALRRYEQKENLVMARRMRDRLSTLRAEAG
jgi:class 3 adenylate cyclase/tetratricopeptide (TPR) repeat protein